MAILAILDALNFDLSKFRQSEIAKISQNQNFIDSKSVKMVILETQNFSNLM